MSKFITLLSFLAVVIKAIDHSYNHEVQKDEHLNVKFVPERKFSVKFLTKTNDPVLTVTCDDGKHIKIFHGTDEPITKEINLKPGTPVELTFLVQDDGVKITRTGDPSTHVKTTTPFTSVTQIKTTGMVKEPVYSKIS
uniref:Cupredoxin_1 domain-containing protein n=1 Tax=Panagrellus redivivus TaxID=6233 RepID=A0A7E4W1A6_PANRE